MCMVHRYSRCEAGARQGGGICNTERELETVFILARIFFSLPTHIHKSYKRGVGDMLVKGVLPTLPTIESDMGGG